MQTKETTFVDTLAATPTTRQPDPFALHSPSMAPKKEPRSSEGTAAAAAAAASSSSSSSASTIGDAPKVEMIWREDEGKSFRVPAFYAPKNNKKVRTDLTMAEVAKHDKRDDAWIIIDGHCYDVTSYVDTHPGGWLPIANLAGKDVTDAFANYHPARVYKTLLPAFYIGEVTDYEVSDFVREHRALRQQLLERNLFETNPWYYVIKFAILTVAFAVMLYTTLVLEQRVLGAIFLGMFWQQLAFVGHDVGHNALSHVRKLDLFWGTAFGNLTGGISLAWWKRSHNVHHIVCNSVENDPDIQHIPLIAITQKMFRPFWSSYHRREYRMDNIIGRFLVGHQHLLFYPIMGFARFNLYVQSWLLLLSTEKIQHKTLEIVSLLGFFAWFGTFLSTFPTWGDVFLFLVVSHFVSGFLHVQITLSSHVPELHDAINGTKAFHQTVNGIRAAVASPLHTITNTTINARNQGDIEQTIDFLYDLGIRTFAMNGMIYSGGGFADPDAIPESAMVPILERIRDHAADKGMRFLWYTPTEYCRLSPVELEIGAKRCNAGEYSIAIEPNGDVLPCQSFYVSAGNILRDPWEQIWRGDLFRSFREREEDPAAWGLPEKCHECPDLPLCGGGCRIERDARDGVRSAESTTSADADGFAPSRAMVSPRAKRSLPVIS